ncbi:MAG TPA: phospholipase D family protein [Kiritimatiellia bacterium]|jgi:phosphatidylserine/phosphatidylglycerophosphate/cardiolipin synthase-like enzyme|nr:phospholipase D family protein [Kiritimatiellia bacterium]HQN79744.1 phospholipase D family protein [Kiritimatiellia bacterium]HQQ60894.1 phospholipase D family protein [Kiritimatiellia bacterium]
MKKAEAILAALFIVSTAVSAAPDRVYLRDGRILEGQVVGEQRGLYAFHSTSTATAPQQIPKNAVKFVLYGDRAKADQALGLKRTAQMGQDAPAASATILPTEAFGQALTPTVQAATQSIWIAAYYISGNITGPIQQFYDTIREKAHAGLNVVLVCEFSAGTRPAIRHATLNYADTLARDGVTVRFIQGYKTMHKKMIIVDGKTVLLGSANLTVAGTTGSNEMNVRIDSPEFARQAATDFARLREKAISARELK